MACLRALECVATVLAAIISKCAHVCFTLFNYGGSLSGCKWPGQLAAILLLMACWRPNKGIRREEPAGPSLFNSLSRTTQQKYQRLKRRLPAKIQQTIKQLHTFSWSKYSVIRLLCPKMEKSLISPLVFKFHLVYFICLSRFSPGCNLWRPEAGVRFLSSHQPRASFLLQDSRAEFLVKGKKLLQL